jgi:hypothetical protein
MPFMTSVIAKRKETITPAAMAASQNQRRTFLGSLLPLDSHMDLASWSWLAS